MLPAYISNYNLSQEKQMILLMIPNAEKEGWHYIAVKTLSALLNGITSKHKGVFIVWIVFILLTTENKLKSHKKCVKLHISVEL